MNKTQVLPQLKKTGHQQRMWFDFLGHPLWYVLGVAALVGLTSYLQFLWWIVAVIALVWGGWVIWQMFGTGAETRPAEAEPLYACLTQSLLYRQQLEHLLQTPVNGSLGWQRQQLAQQLDAWVAAIETLVRQITALNEDPLIQYERAAAPAAQRSLEARLAGETDPAVRAQLERTLVSRQSQIASLARLDSIISRAEIQAEHTLSLFGTIYAQLLTARSTHTVVDYARLSTDLDEAVAQLHDHLEALREVKDITPGHDTRF